MATSKSANTYNRLNWENSDFPVLCKTCLGDNPYIRMSKQIYGKECKICSRPFTVFRWCPGSASKMKKTGSKMKKTEVCQTCSKQKNACQTCILDLKYGLPVQVIDYAMNLKDEIPKSEVNREYYSQNIEGEVANSGASPFGALAKARTPHDLLMKLARTTPYYKRNRPRICSFWVKGECKRGEKCPYRHEKPTDPDDPLADQNIKDRYYGANDPVADKLLRRASAMPKLKPLEDKTITTLYVGNLSEKITEKELTYGLGYASTATTILRHRNAGLQHPPGLMPPGLKPPGPYPPPKPAIHYPSQDPQRMGSCGSVHEYTRSYTQVEKLSSNMQCRGNRGASSHFSTHMSNQGRIL